ncbi:MAG: TIGR03915 family putative DNA repair protein [Alistipes sp.]|jgi:probable DNA metabolism protein|nr:TIGR03915 family putative DNA repair protein [Alistipes sp.]
MVVFRYDKTFEGLLTALFDAYFRRTFPDLLLGDGDSLPLFVTECHTVATDSEKSGRVWRALQKSLPDNVCNMLVMGWLSEEPGVDMMLMRYMRHAFSSPSGSSGGQNADSSRNGDSGKGGGRKAKTNSVATDFSNPDILRIKQLAQKVANEREHLMQFTRFQKSADAPDDTSGNGRSELCYAENESETAESISAGAGATYFAPVSPRYNALPLAIPYFRDRFRDQRWLIYDIKRRYGYYYDLQNVTEVTMDDDAHLLDGQLDEAMMAEDEKLFQELWRTYFHSMAIAERINPRLQRQHMPRRFWPLLTEKP